MACLLASWAVEAGYLTSAHSVHTLWERGLCKESENVNFIGALSQEVSCDAAGRLLGDPGSHISEPQDGLCTIEEDADPYGLGDPDQDTCYHLIQDEEVVSELHQNVLPPDE